MRDAHPNRLVLAPQPRCIGGVDIFKTDEVIGWAGVRQIFDIIYTYSMVMGGHHQGNAQQVLPKQTLRTSLVSSSASSTPVVQPATGEWFVERINECLSNRYRFYFPLFTLRSLDYILLSGSPGADRWNWRSVMCLLVSVFPQLSDVEVIACECCPSSPCLLRTYRRFLFMRTSKQTIIAVLFSATLDIHVESSVGTRGRKSWAKIPPTDLSEFAKANGSLKVFHFFLHSHFV